MTDPAVDRSSSRERLRRGAYLMPSVLTIGNMVLGFYAVIRGLRGDFHTAAYLLFAAGILDTLDGRIARAVGSDSAFGREYDSLADVMTFGFVPSLLSYLWGLDALGRIGWLVPAFFVVCTATRLARFNVQAEVVDKRYFVGMPCPAAAGVIASLFLVLPLPEPLLQPDHRGLLLGVMLFALVAGGALMVSTFRYPSLKQVDGQKWSYRKLLFPAILILIFAWWPTAFFFTVAVVYTVTGPLGWVIGRLRRSGSDEPVPSADEDEGENRLRDAAGDAGPAAVEQP